MTAGAGPHPVATPGLDALLASKEMVLVCGSGGVGKTTTAAAIGLQAATELGGRVLVLTVDPARRLADALGLGGVGVGNYRTRIGVNGTNFDYVKGRTTAFQWQGIAGLAVSISPDVDLFGEYRYRSNETNANFGGGNRDDVQREGMAIKRAVTHREGKQVDIDRVQNELD